MGEYGKLILTAGGVYCGAVAVFHVFFWRLFDWKRQLKRVSFLNRNVMQIMNLVLMALLVLISVLSLAHADEILNTDLGQTLMAGIALVWFSRAAEQVYFFGARHAGSNAFTALFTLGGVLYTLPLFA